MKCEDAVSGEGRILGGANDYEKTDSGENHRDQRGHNRPPVLGQLHDRLPGGGILT